jgi:hypothetical protein
VVVKFGWCDDDVINDRGGGNVEVVFPKIPVGCVAASINYGL